MKVIVEWTLEEFNRFLQCLEEFLKKKSERGKEREDDSRKQDNLCGETGESKK